MKVNVNSCLVTISVAIYAIVIHQSPLRSQSSVRISDLSHFPQSGPRFSAVRCHCYDRPPWAACTLGGRPEYISFVPICRKTKTGSIFSTLRTIYCNPPESPKQPFFETIPLLRIVHYEAHLDWGHDKLQLKLSCPSPFNRNNFLFKKKVVMLS